MALGKDKLPSLNAQTFVIRAPMHGLPDALPLSHKNSLATIYHAS